MPTLEKKIGVHVLPQDLVDYDTWQEIVLLRFRKKFPNLIIDLSGNSFRFYNPRIKSRFYTISTDMIELISNNIDKKVETRLPIFLIEKT